MKNERDALSQELTHRSRFTQKIVVGCPTKKYQKFFYQFSFIYLFTIFLFIHFFTRFFHLFLCQISLIYLFNKNISHNLFPLPNISHISLYQNSPIYLFARFLLIIYFFDGILLFISFLDDFHLFLCQRSPIYFFTRFLVFISLTEFSHISLYQISFCIFLCKNSSIYFFVRFLSFISLSQFPYISLCQISFIKARKILFH